MDTPDIASKVLSYTSIPQKMNTLLGLNISDEQLFNTITQSGIPLLEIATMVENEKERRSTLGKYIDTLEYRVMQLLIASNDYWDIGVSDTHVRVYCDCDIATNSIHNMVPHSILDERAVFIPSSDPKQFSINMNKIWNLTPVKIKDNITIRGGWVWNDKF